PGPPPRPRRLGAGTGAVGGGAQGDRELRARGQADDRRRRRDAEVRGRRSEDELKDANDVGLALADICEAAAALILPLWRSGVEVLTKADESPVTEADRRGEALILDRLARRFPGVPVVSEEDASEFGTPDAIGPRFFLVDPLDGTKAFVRGDPH